MVSDSWIGAFPGDFPIEELILPVRVHNLLKRGGLHSVGDVTGSHRADLSAIGLSDTQIDLIRRVLVDHRADIPSDWPDGA